MGTCTLLMYFAHVLCSCTFLPEPKKNDLMHQLRLAISYNVPYHVVKAYCSYVAGCSGMYSHIVGLHKQLIHYIMMKLKFVPVDLACTQMQQPWHKPCPTEIQPVPVMNVSFCKAKQSEAKKDPVTCTLYEARAKCVQDAKRRSVGKLPCLCICKNTNACSSGTVH